MIVFVPFLVLFIAAAFAWFECLRRSRGSFVHEIVSWCKGWR